MGLDGTSGPGGRISVIWGTEGREFKSPQPDHLKRCLGRVHVPAPVADPIKAVVPRQ